MENLDLKALGREEATRRVGVTRTRTRTYTILLLISFTHPSREENGETTEIKAEARAKKGAERE